MPIQSPSCRPVPVGRRRAATMPATTHASSTILMWTLVGSSPQKTVDQPALSLQKAEQMFLDDLAASSRSCTTTTKHLVFEEGAGLGTSTCSTSISERYMTSPSSRRWVMIQSRYTGQRIRYAGPHLLVGADRAGARRTSRRTCIGWSDLAALFPQAAGRRDPDSVHHHRRLILPRARWHRADRSHANATVPKEIEANLDARLSPR